MQTNEVRVRETSGNASANLVDSARQYAAVNVPRSYILSWHMLGAAALTMLTNSRRCHPAAIRSEPKERLAAETASSFVSFCTGVLLRSSGVVSANNLGNKTIVPGNHRSVITQCADEFVDHPV